MLPSYSQHWGGVSQHWGMLVSTGGCYSALGGQIILISGTTSFGLKDGTHGLQRTYPESLEHTAVSLHQLSPAAQPGTAHWPSTIATLPILSTRALAPADINWNTMCKELTGNMPLNFKNPFMAIGQTQTLFKRLLSISANLYVALISCNLFWRLYLCPWAPEDTAWHKVARRTRNARVCSCSVSEICEYCWGIKI